jgi:hypothetical protein
MVHGEPSGLGDVSPYPDVNYRRVLPTRGQKVTNTQRIARIARIHELFNLLHSEVSLLADDVEDGDAKFYGIASQVDATHHDFAETVIF